MLELGASLHGCSARQSCRDPFSSPGDAETAKLELTVTKTLSAGHISSCRAHIRYSYRIFFCSSRRAQVSTFMNMLKSAPRSQRANVRSKHLSYASSPQKTDCCKSLYTRISHSTVRSRELDLAQNRSEIDNACYFPGQATRSPARSRKPEGQHRTAHQHPHRCSSPLGAGWGRSHGEVALVPAAAWDLFYCRFIWNS